MCKTTPLLPGLSPVSGKTVEAAFDGGSLTSDAGVLVLREVERRLNVGGRLAACIADDRQPGRVRHSLADVIRFRMLMIACGYEDAIDADSLRSDPGFKMALGRLPSAADLCSQSTISRLENRPEVRTLLRMAGAMVDLYCASFAQVPRRIVLDLDDTFDAAHGGQQLRLFNAHFDNHGFQPILVFDGEGRIVAAVLRPARRPSGREIAGHLRRLIRRLRANWPRVEILIRADSHYAAPEVIDLCRSAGVDFILGLSTNPALRARVASLEASTVARQSGSGKPGSGKPGSGKIRRFAEFFDAARSWRRVERIVARVEAGPQGVDTRFIVTSLETGRGKRLYEHLYCRRGEAENHIKAFKRHLAADRTSCHRAAANQMRLMLHAGAYWLMWTLRAAAPRRSAWRTVQFDTLRLRLLKIAARIVEMKTKIKLHLPTACPVQPALALILTRTTRLVI